MTAETAIVLLALIGSVTIIGITYIAFRYLKQDDERERIEYIHGLMDRSAHGYIPGGEIDD